LAETSSAAPAIATNNRQGDTRFVGFEEKAIRILSSRVAVLV
jgi:hypothetical protein